MTKRQISRRGVLKGSLMASVIGGTGKFLRALEGKSGSGRRARAKPIKLGLTCDASGQYGNSGQDDLRGIQMAIDEVNAKGGVLGRKIDSGSRPTPRRRPRPAAASPSVSSPGKTAPS